MGKGNISVFNVSQIIGLSDRISITLLIITNFTLLVVNLNKSKQMELNTLL